MERSTLRELTNLPKAVILEYLRERRKTNLIKKFVSRFDFTPGSRNETLAALAPFLIVALVALVEDIEAFLTLPMWIQVASTLFIWFSVFSLFVIGFAQRAPRWFMPYMGLPLPFFGILLFNALMDRLSNLNYFLYVWYDIDILNWYRLPWFLSDFLQQGLLWVWMVILVLLLIVATRSVPKSRPFYQRLRDDWTLLSFIIYGTMPLALFITFNEYKNEEPFMFLSFLILAVGGRLYLRSDVPWNKFLFLQGGVALSMLVAAAGKAVLEESSFPFGGGTWQIEFMSTIVTWVWLAMLMLLPLAFKLLPRSDTTPRTA
jgi:hypothetical protein